MYESFSLLDAEQLHILLPEAQRCLSKATDKFKTTVTALKEGSITLHEIDILTEEKTMKQFVETYGVSISQKRGNVMPAEQLQKVMEWRKRELSEWKEEKQLTRHLLQILKDEKLSQGILNVKTF